MADFNDSSKILTKISHNTQKFGSVGAIGLLLLLIACSKFVPEKYSPNCMIPDSKIQNFPAS